MKNKIFPFIASYSLWFVFLFLFNSCNAKKAGGTNNNISLQTDSLRLFKTTIDSLLRQNGDLKKDLNLWFSQREVMKLKQKGITDPSKDITEDLRNNPQIIPYHGILGGSMYLGNITLLRDRWVIADFSDGHIMGTMILKYTIQKDNSLKWAVIDRYLE